MLSGKQSWLDRQPYQIKEKYNFEEDKVIDTLIFEVDGEVKMTAVCEGEWNSK